MRRPFANNYKLLCAVAYLFLFCACAHFGYQAQKFPLLITANNTEKNNPRHELVSLPNSYTTSAVVNLDANPAVSNDSKDTGLEIETEVKSVSQSITDSPNNLTSCNRSPEVAYKTSEKSPSHVFQHGEVGINDRGEPLWTPDRLTKELRQEEIIKAHENFCFNSRVSQSISLNRDIPDYRPLSCINDSHHLKTLPQASVIITFHNEEFSVMIRSIHSILNRTPPSLLTEIILVDDMSDLVKFPWLSAQLDGYVKWLPKTTILRLRERHGLMRARMAGIQAAKSSITVILDSHIEVGHVWLEPLLKVISQDEKIVALPTIMSIDPNTFEIDQHGIGILGFSWSMGHASLYRQQSDFAPTASPIMAGGLFAISKKWFNELGQYDSQLNLYGGEEFELSFKIWMCGGQLLLIPCSKVAHVFRTSKYWDHQVYEVPGEIIIRNKMRVANVWMDEYAFLVNRFFGKQNLDIGSLEQPKNFRNQLKCKSFAWYLKNVYPELKTPQVKSSMIGEIRHNASKLCFDTFSNIAEGEDVKVYPCHENGGTQAFFKDGASPLIYPFSQLLNFCIEAIMDTFELRENATISLRYTTNCQVTQRKLVYNSQTHRIIIDGLSKLLPDCITLTSDYTNIQLVDCSKESQNMMMFIQESTK